MKKLKNYSFLWALASIFLVFGCEDPLKDDIDAINETESVASAKELVYTLTDDDYDVADDACDCARFGNFSSEEDVRAGIPAVLSNNFVALGAGSTAAVTYKFFNGSSPDLRKDQFVFTVSDAEYEALGFRFGNFSNLSRDIPIYAASKEDGRDGQYMDITHEFFTGSGTELRTSRAVYTVAYGWQWAFELPLDAYGDFFGESGTDFSNAGEGREKMPAYLNYLLSTADNFNDLSIEEGETLVVQYLFDDRCFGANCDDPGEPNVPDVGLFIFSGGEWLLYNDHFQTTDETLNFGHDGTAWVPDNTVKYRITAADFGVIGDNANNLGNQGARDNLNTFGNFNTGNWSNAEIIEALDFVLKLRFPNSEVGQKYLVTYNTFPGGDLESKVILDENGDYIPFTD